MVPARRQAELSPEGFRPKTTVPVFRSPAQDARALQARAQAWASDGSPEPGKWSRRRTLAFLVVASLVLWAGIAAFGSALIRSFA
jgi:hypothetical protein